jgi:uncharacterized protein YcfJ
MKQLLMTAGVVALTSTTAMAETPKNVRVFDHTKIVTQSVPSTERRCFKNKKPVYSTYKEQGDAASGALLGMILGGVIGKGVTGDDGGAAAGAVVGGLIGADKGAKPRTQREIIGYEMVETCENVTLYYDQKTEVYSHSTIRFFVDGKRYVLEFQR